MHNNFYNYFKLRDFIETEKAVYLPENFDWAKNIADMLPNLNLGLPVIHKKSKIKIILDKRNPICIFLSDGSQLMFTHEEFKRIDGKPMCGKTLSWGMQRLPNDGSSEPSKITYCKVI